MNAPHRTFGGDLALARARRMYARVLSGWAIDLLALRRTGQITPSAREGLGTPVQPGPDALALRAQSRWAIGIASSDIRWRPQKKAA